MSFLKKLGIVTTKPKIGNAVVAELKGSKLHIIWKLNAQYVGLIS